MSHVCVAVFSRKPEDVKKLMERYDWTENNPEYQSYIGIPKQYYVAREYQVVSVLSDLSDLLKKFPEPEKQQQVKEAVFLNIMMKTVGDGRKYIQSLQSMLANGFLPAYLKEQQRLGEQARERLQATRPDSKPMLDRFVRENGQITEDLQLSMDKSLLKARRTETRSKPSRIVTKSITMLKDVDTRIFEIRGTIRDERFVIFILCTEAKRVNDDLRHKRVSFIALRIDRHICISLLALPITLVMPLHLRALRIHICSQCFQSLPDLLLFLIRLDPIPFIMNSS